MIKIEVFKEDAVVHSRQGGDNTYYYQQAYIHRESERFPVSCWIPMRKDSAPYQSGLYTIASESVLVNQYKSLELSRFRLQLEPIKQ